MMNRLLPYVILILSGILLLRGLDVISDGLPKIQSAIHKNPLQLDSVNHLETTGKRQAPGSSATNSEPSSAADGSKEAGGFALDPTPASPSPAEPTTATAAAALTRSRSPQVPAAENPTILPEPAPISPDDAQYNRCLALLSDNQFTATEVDMLQRLKQRRQEMDNRERWLDTKEAAIRQMERDLATKITSLERHQQAMERHLSQHGQNHGNRIGKLVKVYESMDPKEAAHVFNSLPLDVLLDVAEQMKESKLSSILARMEVDKAKQLTTSMAKQQQPQFHVSPLED